MAHIDALALAHSWGHSVDNGVHGGSMYKAGCTRTQLGIFLCLVAAMLNPALECEGFLPFHNEEPTEGRFTDQRPLHTSADSNRENL